MRTMLMIYRETIGSGDVHWLFVLMLVRRYNKVNVYKVNKQVNDNSLCMMDSVVRDPSVQLYLF